MIFNEKATPGIPTSFTVHYSSFKLAHYSIFEYFEMLLNFVACS